MKATLLFIFILFSTLSFGQLIDGTLVDENRKMISNSSFKVIDNNVGVLFYVLAVDRKGNVTSATIESKGTTVISTPTRMKVRNHLMTFKFEEGTHYPEFHHVRVKITVAKE
jgi:hypothetical protein